MSPGMMSSRGLGMRLALAATGKLSRQGSRVKLMGGVEAIKNETLKHTAVKECLDRALDGFLKAPQL